MLELRQYTMQPGGFDKLLDLFRETLVREQEAVGMHLVGFFHHLGDPLRFVWIRGVDGMPQRTAACQAFYGGPVWKQLAGVTNATLVDSSDVLLLRPIDGRGFARSPLPGPEAEVAGTARVLASLLFLKALPDAAARVAFASALDGARLEILALAETETADNTWTRHPVRTGEPVLAAFTWVDAPAVDEARGRIDAALAPLRSQAGKPVEHLVLKPAAGSRVR